MAIKAKISDHRMKNGTLLLSIEYKKDDDVICVDNLQFTEAPTSDYLGTVVARRIDRLKALEAFAGGLQPGTKIDPIDPTNETEKQKEKDRIDYVKKLDKLENKKRLLELGVITPEEAGIESLKEEVKLAHDKVER